MQDMQGWRQYRLDYFVWIIQNKKEKEKLITKKVLRKKYNRHCLKKIQTHFNACRPFLTFSL